LRKKRKALLKNKVEILKKSFGTTQGSFPTEYKQTTKNNNGVEINGQEKRSWQGIIVFII
jgi:hypothetical protein